MAVPDREMYLRYLSENQEDEALLDAATKRIAARRQIIDGLLALHPELKEPAPVVTPAPVAALATQTTTAALGPPASQGVLMVAKAEAGRFMTVNEMVAEFQGRGWTASKMAIRLACKRGAEKGQLSRGPDHQGHQTFGMAPAVPAMLEAVSS
ncbi:MAG TPA: hypothetical protein VME70_09025 [Mycobacteriales bacterium]|nr:hypothetical protein [Mycobacteriales bacterium]